MALKILQTDKTPYIYCNEGIIEIKGRSIIENPEVFYAPLKEWMEEYFQHTHSFTEVNIQIEYSNSNSNKYLFKLLSILEQAYNYGCDLKINWYYESDDDTLRELGLDYQSIIDVPFELITSPSPGK